jgi:hypothetical protein
MAAVSNTPVCSGAANDLRREPSVNGRRFHEQESALYNDLLVLRLLRDDQRWMSGGSPDASLEAGYLLLNRQK